MINNYTVLCALTVLIYGYPTFTADCRWPQDIVGHDLVALTADEELQDLLEKMVGVDAQQNDGNRVLQCLDRGASVNCTNSGGHTILHVAALGNNPALMDKGLACGCTINAITILDETPLHCAARSGSLDILRMLIQAGASVNQTMADGNTPLHLAALYNRHACVLALLAAGANYTTANGNGHSPLDLALQDGFTDTAQALKVIKGNKV